MSCPTIGDMPRLRPDIQSLPAPLLRSRFSELFCKSSRFPSSGGGFSIKSISRAFMPKLDSLFNQLIDSFYRKLLAREYARVRTPDTPCHARHCQ